MRVLVVTSVDVEQAAVLKGLQQSNQPAFAYDVHVVGVGAVAAAVGTMKRLASTDSSYQLVINAGIAGRFSAHTTFQPGECVLANRIIAADLGAEHEQGFHPLSELGFGQDSFQIEDNLLQTYKTNLHCNVGPILTVSTVTGSSSRAQILKQRYPNALAEAMEGFGVASAAHSYGLPCLELRTMSNIVGPRDRNKWNIQEALHALTDTFRTIGGLTL
jgi:futalosine hydrolase